MRRAYLKMILATVLFGSYLVASKLVLREAPVFTATFVRLVSAALVLGPVVWLRGGPRWERPSRRDALLLFGQSALGVFLFSIFAMQGVRLTGGIESGVILSLVPIAVTVVAVLFLGERLRLGRGAGIVLSVAGAAGISAMAARAAPTAADGAWLGTVLLLCAVACEAVFLTFGRFLSRPLAPERLSLVLAVVGAALFAVPAMLEPNGLLRGSYGWQTWLLMVYTGVAINGLAAVLVYESMEHIDTTVAAGFTALTPVSGTVLAMLFLGEALHGYHVGGMALVIAGVFIVAGTGAKQNAPRPARGFGRLPKVART